ncbi:ArsR/SmtB family transcription factor [Amnibacterium flavum]|uniref:Transcriptional regulator n=1 Tax=Amnibacterium flavum TaxID=2173173 RepID=A0A2V1HSP4_9MICO|nr:metalloregulator ArsR/SmtB family transcription factor [Amnibacterium flavum]PVZ95588.1 transcriptional regulator [Amnibacterium flavum]
MADIFDVIADATRRDLLRALLERYLEGPDAPHGGEMSVGELVVAMGLSQPTVSKHLKVLRDIQLVTVRDQGQHRFYRLDYSPLETVEDWLLPFLSADYDGMGADDAPPAVLGAGPRLVASRIGAASGAVVYAAAGFASRLRSGRGSD